MVFGLRSLFGLVKFKDLRRSTEDKTQKRVGSGDGFGEKSGNRLRGRKSSTSYKRPSVGAEGIRLTVSETDTKTSMAILSSVKHQYLPKTHKEV